MSKQSVKCLDNLKKIPKIANKIAAKLLVLRANRFYAHKLSERAENFPVNNARTLARYFCLCMMVALTSLILYRDKFLSHRLGQEPNGVIWNWFFLSLFRTLVQYTTVSLMCPISMHACQVPNTLGNSLLPTAQWVLMCKGLTLKLCQYSTWLIISVRRCLNVWLFYFDHELVWIALHVTNILHQQCNSRLVKCLLSSEIFQHCSLATKQHHDKWHPLSKAWCGAFLGFLCVVRSYDYLVWCVPTTTWCGVLLRLLGVVRS